MTQPSWQEEFEKLYFEEFGKVQDREEAMLFENLFNLIEHCVNQAVKEERERVFRLAKEIAEINGDIWYSELKQALQDEGKGER